MATKAILARLDRDRDGAIRVIHLHAFDIECAICGRDWSYSPEGPSFGVPTYEGVIVPDDYVGDWGGQPVCPRCYFITRGVQAEHPGRHVSMGLIRGIAIGGERDHAPGGRK